MHVENIRKHIPNGGEHYDVIICGGGPAGLGAAWGAATQGAKTLLLEARSFFGGTAQIGLWMPMNRLFTKGESRGGVHEAFIKELHSFGDVATVRGIDNPFAKDGLDIHPDYLRLAVFRFLESIGCHYRLYSPVTGVVKDGDVLKGVITTGKDGNQTFYADVFVDTTGDGDLAHQAGVPMEMGSTTGRTLPISLSFAVANTDAERALEYLNDPEGNKHFKQLVLEAREEGYATAQWYYFDRTTVPGMLSINNGGPYQTWERTLDGTKVQDLVIGERLGIEIAIDFIKWVRAKQVPGLEDCYLARVSPHVGIRETRRMVGQYKFDEKDSQEDTYFDDVILLRYGEHIDGQYFTGLYHSGHPFPYRALLPVNVERLLVAGRCASFTHVGAAIGRSMGNMMGMGQAAGVAAAVSVKSKVTPRQANVKEIQKTLMSMGVELGLESV